MATPRTPTWSVLGRLALAVAAFSVVGVLGGGTALRHCESGHPRASLWSWGDAVWWSVPTMTTVGYGDVVPATTVGRPVAAGVLMVSVAVIAALAAGVALGVTRSVTRPEERGLEAEAEADVRERGLKSQLNTIETRLAHLQAPSMPFHPDGLWRRRSSLGSSSSVPGDVGP